MWWNQVHSIHCRIVCFDNGIRLWDNWNHSFTCVPSTVKMGPQLFEILLQTHRHTDIHKHIYTGIYHWNWGPLKLHMHQDIAVGTKYMIQNTTYYASPERMWHITTGRHLYQSKWIMQWYSVVNSYNLSPGERKPAHWCRSEKSVAWNIYGNVLLFHSCTINMALSVSMSSPEGNDSELVGKNGHQKNDYLVFKCYLANCSQLIKR